MIADFAAAPQVTVGPKREQFIAIGRDKLAELDWRRDDDDEGVAEAGDDAPQVSFFFPKSKVGTLIRDREVAVDKAEAARLRELGVDGE